MFGSKCYKHPESSCVRNVDVELTGFEVFNRLFKSWDGTNWAMSAGLANFLAGGMASNAYWLTALRKSSAYMCDCNYWKFLKALDNVKNRIMSGGPSSSHHPLLTQYLFIADDIKTPRYRSVFDAYRQVWNEAYDGSKGLRWNVLARTKNFYRVGRQISYCFRAINWRPRRVVGFCPSRTESFSDKCSSIGRMGGCHEMVKGIALYLPLTVHVYMYRSAANYHGERGI